MSSFLGLYQNYIQPSTTEEFEGFDSQFSQCVKANLSRQTAPPLSYSTFTHRYMESVILFDFIRKMLIFTRKLR